MLVLWFFVPTGIGIDIHLDPPIGIGIGTWTATYCTAGRNYQPSLVLVLVCFPHCRFRDLITSNQSGQSIKQQTILAAEVPFILLHKLFGFSSSLFSSFNPHSKRHNRPTDAEVHRREGELVAGCPVFVLFVRPARIRFRLASPLPVFAIGPRDYSSRLLSNSGGPLKRLALGKACGLQRFLLLARIVLSSRSDSIRLRSLPIVARSKVHGLNHHEHPRPFEYRHPPSLECLSLPSLYLSRE